MIILDISGNPLTSDKNYRIYTLFNLNNIKVLDGVPVEYKEQQLARNLFKGRLTEDLLLDRLNGKTPKDI